MYDDLTRLTFARTTICSISTFCYWPAIANPNTAYFPKSLLIAQNSMPYYGEHFKWIESEIIRPTGISIDKTMKDLQAKH
jgi:hypothetical protein